MQGLMAGAKCSTVIKKSTHILYLDKPLVQILIIISYLGNTEIIISVWRGHGSFQVKKSFRLHCLCGKEKS
jgi:hypothetical protein